MINSPRRNQEFFDWENNKRKPDIWYYTNNKRRAVSELNLNIVEVTLPWNDTVINPEKFNINSDPSYIHAPFILMMFR
jgi:hypothetical protein